MLDKASELFEEMPSNDVEWNVYSFTALINAYGRNGQYEASLHLLARMKRERVTPNLITYNTVINACAKGGLDWEGLLGLFAQMRHEGIQPDIITYNTLLSACSRSNPFLYRRLITFCFFLLLWCVSMG
jgi:pentatricopeptide repeat protein